MMLAIADDELDSWLTAARSGELFGRPLGKKLFARDFQKYC